MQQVAANPAQALTWTEAGRQFQARVAHARATYAPHLPDLSDDGLAASLDWLEPYLAGCDRLSQVRALDLLSILRARLDYADLAALDRRLPPRLTLKASTHDIDYTGAVPTVSARAQAFTARRRRRSLRTDNSPSNARCCPRPGGRRRSRLISQDSGRKLGRHAPGHARTLSPP